VGSGVACGDRVGGFSFAARRERRPSELRIELDRFLGNADKWVHCLIVGAGLSRDIARSILRRFSLSRGKPAPTLGFDIFQFQKSEAARISNFG